MASDDEGKEGPPRLSSTTANSARRGPPLPQLHLVAPLSTSNTNNAATCYRDHNASRAPLRGSRYVDGLGQPPPTPPSHDPSQQPPTCSPSPHPPPPGHPPSTWTSPDRSSADFRSDVVTSPTASMLHAISSATLLDDVFCEDPSTISLETRLASLTGHESAVLPPHAVLCDDRAHILEWEAGGVASLSGALVQGVVPGNGRFLTLEDVKRKVVLSDDVHACPTRVISLENTLGGSIMPLDETRRIAGWARENGILMHLDGARLWEAVVAGAGGLEEYTRCFDTVSLCFSKGLGAPIGSILLGSKEVVKRARWVRKSIGGGLRQSGV
ncbi:hypothetical protein VE04_06227, partial [Pseudogymnoascus sp. 24MN13]